ncbi:unnamed protein product, partial [Callosobruchus maculatus]
MGWISFLTPLVAIAVLLLEQAGGFQIPTYLKNRYHMTDAATRPPYQNGPYQNGPYQSQPSSFKTDYQYKTKTKTSYSSAKNPFHGGSRVYSGGCTSQPPIPPNSKMMCSSYSGCKVTCQSNYQFATGDTQLMYTCVNGNWLIEGGFVDVVACQPICLPPCQNSGICVAPNQCSCHENFSGPQCQFESKPCLNLPPMPLNSKRVCKSQQCTVECVTGHKFPDGSDIAQMVCNNGMWVPTKDKWVAIPDCQPTCDPPCQNGGNCLSYNVCQCPIDYRGPQCQYR